MGRNIEWVRCGCGYSINAGLGRRAVREYNENRDGIRDKIHYTRTCWVDIYSAHRHPFVRKEKEDPVGE